MWKAYMKPTFKVLYEEFNKNEIQFENWFEFGQWTTIKKELSGLIKKFRKLENLDFKKSQKEVKEFFLKNMWSDEFKKCKSLEELIEYSIERRLERLCMYYFWSKCEYEVIVSSWPPREGSEIKIDIYDQLKANWNIFRELVFKELKLR
jgi:hypothetical protein